MAAEPPAVTLTELSVFVFATAPRTRKHVRNERNRDLGHLREHALLEVGRDEGMRKLLFDEGTERLIGRGIGLTAHPHPTFSEAIGVAAEGFEGTIIDLYLPRKR
jgi:hypothetical protein